LSIRDGIFFDYAKLPVYQASWDRLSATISKIEEASLLSLTDPHYLATLISTAGLYTDGRPMYGKWQKFTAPREAPAVWQHPEEFANFLIWASSKKLTRVLEIGTFYGFTSVVAERYLSRFNTNLTYIASDLHQWIPPLNECGFKYKPFCDIQYEPHKRSLHYKGSNFDLVFIDADHRYNSVSSDYERLKDCPLVTFHDINDEVCGRECPKGGVPAFWQEIKRTRPSVEFLRDDGKRWMGIGVLS
jgi:hypothetical protein